MQLKNKTFLEDIFWSVLADSDIQLYLYEPVNMAEEMQRREAKAALATQQDMVGGDHSDPELPKANSDLWQLYSNCLPMPTESESFYCNYFSTRGSFLDAVPNTNPVSPCARYYARICGLGIRSSCTIILLNLGTSSTASEA